MMDNVDVNVWVVVRYAVVEVVGVCCCEFTVESDTNMWNMEGGVGKGKQRGTSLR